MRSVIIAALVVGAVPFVCAACSDTAGAKLDAGLMEDAAADGAVFDNGAELRVPVPESGRVFVKLSPPSIVPVADQTTSLDWDLAFEGLDIFTNSGVSGAGKGAAFGPFEPIVFVGAEAPEVPFLIQDKPGGAFIDWYAYEGASHGLWSRYHVYGVEDGARRWKVQVLTYYGERDGAAVSGLYKLRYAELTSGAGPTQEVVLDGTAGGTAAPASSPSECIDLGTGARTMLAPAEASSSSAWHLCVRRSSINVNGGIGGPRGVGAVDLDADQVAQETVAAVMARTADGEKGRFEAVTSSSFDGKTFRGDRVETAFSDKWIDGARASLAPAYAAWLVRDAAGAQKFLVGFVSFESSTTTSPGTVVMRIKPVKG
jgi:hypothetical protein